MQIHIHQQLENWKVMFSLDNEQQAAEEVYC